MSVQGYNPRTGEPYGEPVEATSDTEVDRLCDAAAQAFRIWSERSAADRATVLDSYGAKNKAEFFAVATETFFEKPVQLERDHPELYAQLKQFYGQDPARRMPPIAP